MLKSVDSPLLAVLVMVLALALANLFVRDPAAKQGHEHAAIDGLRALLSPMVFLHHSICWYQFGHTRVWMPTPSTLFRNFGPVSVALFFMITSFLFCSKLIEARTTKMDWLRLYVSRLLRLTPLYWCAVAAVTLFSGIETNFRLIVSPAELWVQLQRWMLFTVSGAADINGYPSWMVIAGVTWTLVYEWYFYCLLPVIGLAIGVRRGGESPLWLILGVLTVFSMSGWGVQLNGLYPFVGGAVAAAVVHSPGLRERLKVRGANLMTVLCIWLAFVALPYGVIAMPTLALLTTGFVLIACGVNAFGVLTWRPMRALSALSYGVYLWHGIVLFVAMRYCVGPARLPTLTPGEHWLIVFGCLPVVIGLSALTYRWVERPAMQSAGRVTEWLRSLLPPEPVTVESRLDDAAKPS